METNVYEDRKKATWFEIDKIWNLAINYAIKKL